MRPNPIPTIKLAPTFPAVTFPAVAATHPLLVGQARLLSAFDIQAALPKQGLYIADFESIARRLLVRTLAEYAEQSYQFLYGRITRAQLFGSAQQPSPLTAAGLLFIDIEALLTRPNLWEALLDVMLHDGFTQQKQWHELKARIILIGHSGYYSELLHAERCFQALFPLYGEVNDEIDAEPHLGSYVGWLQALATEVNATIAPSALTPLLRYSCELSDHQQRLSLASQPFMQLFTEAAAVAKGAAIEADHIQQARQQRKQRHNAQEQLSAQNVDDAFIHLPTSGETIGQICGLTVIDSGDYMYGEPARITASVHYGDGEVADIERKSELGGNIHAKGMMILSSCLYRIFGRDAPLHLSANIVFEQSYQEIDGDSASLAEYCCLISAITEQPINQGIAITGALDQFGNVQAIGGVNEKIEGFFNLCARRGLTGEQGVIIPRSNVQQLNLPQAIITAVEAGKFHLYEIAHVDDAMELLMNRETGKADESDNFPEDSLYGLVQLRLDGLAGNSDDDVSTWFTRLLRKLKLVRY